LIIFIICWPDQEVIGNKRALNAVSAAGVGSDWYKPGWNRNVLIRLKAPVGASSEVKDRAYL